MNYKGEGADIDPTDGNSPATVIDVIAGAGGPSPSPAWSIVTDPNHPVGAAWVQPDDVIEPDPTPEPVPCPDLEIPGYETIGGDNLFRSQVGVPLEVDMALAGQTLNNGSSVWFSRTCYSILALRISNPNADIAPVIKKHRNEWRAILGLPPL